MGETGCQFGLFEELRPEPPARLRFVVGRAATPPAIRFGLWPATPIALNGIRAPGCVGPGDSRRLLSNDSIVAVPLAAVLPLRRPSKSTRCSPIPRHSNDSSDA